MQSSTTPAWVLPALLASLCFAAHYVLLRGASGKIGDAFGGFLLETAAAVGLLLLMVVSPKDPVPTTSAGMLWSVLSGLMITGGVTLLFMSLRLGGPVAGTGTIALGGGVALAALLAPLFFQESLSPRRVLGVLLGLAATLLLATEKVEGARSAGGEPSPPKESPTAPEPAQSTPGAGESGE
jgi:drug/metabolite transporter (DMT)-like permease